MLRAIRQSSVHRCRPEVLLDVSDRRTLKQLLERSGLDTRKRKAVPSVDEFLAQQRFVDVDNEGLKILRAILTTRP
jgi:hypothetical protein